MCIAIHRYSQQPKTHARMMLLKGMELSEMSGDELRWSQWMSVGVSGSDFAALRCSDNLGQVPLSHQRRLP